MSKVGEKIKELRLESGATQLQLGEYVGCSGQVISNIERGYTNPSAAILKKISEYFHVPSDYLLGKSKSQYPERICYAEHRNLSQDFQIPKYIHRLPDRRHPVSDNRILRG